MPHMNPVGETRRRRDALEKVLGRTLFSADFKMPGMLEGKVLRSQVPHAFINKLDMKQALTLPGVHAVFTAQDIPGGNSHGILVKDEPVLVKDRIRKIGDPLAFVVAESGEIAEQALALIKVELEILPAVFDPELAMKPDAVEIYPGGNILERRTIRKGDVKEAFSRADILVENTYSTHMTEHAYIEPEAGLAFPDGDSVVIRVSTQNPHFDRKEVARNLALPLNQVRVIQAATGGGFGGKLDVSVQVLVALAALKTRRPVRLVYSRKESVISSTKRHPMTIHYRTAADKMGKLLGMEATIIGDTGAYASYGPGTLTRSAVHVTGPYAVPNVQIDAYTVYTNNPTAGAMRGFGVPQVAFAHEQQMDLVAERAGISPFTIRMLNFLKTGSETATGQVLTSGVGIRETLKQAYAKAEQNNGLAGGLGR